jgi:hypothetical protein
VTVVERRSRLLLLGELPHGHGAQEVYESSDSGSTTGVS